MDLSHFRMLINGLLKKDLDIVTYEAPLIILDSKYVVCMANNGKDTKHTRHIYRRLNLVRNSEDYKINKIDWYEGGMQLEEISTKNVGEKNLNPRMNYIMVRLENWHRTLAHEGWQDTG